jgi:hypothetical protein
MTAAQEKAIKARIAALSPESKALWGKMNVHQMLCHCADQLRLTLGDLTAKPFGGWFNRTILKFLVLYVIKAPKGKVKTAPEVAQEHGGTQPTSFEEDRNTLLELIDRFLSNPQAKMNPHPSFGKMSRKEWARLIHIHLDFHLTQFGV